MHYVELRAAREELIASGAPFEIVEADVRGLRLRTYRDAPPSVRDLWLSTAAFAERPYLVYADERLSYGEAHARVAAIAAWLVTQGVQPGDRVALSMRNYPEWVLVYWACLASGVTLVGMNAWWTPEEMAYALADAAPKVLFVDAERLARLAPDIAVPVVGVRLDAPAAGVIPWAEVIAHGGDLPDVTIDPDSDACIFYTSGTTGKPKGAQLTHRGCISNLLNMRFAEASGALATERATGVPRPAPFVPITLITTPLFHVSANNCSLYPVTAGGGTVVLMYRWDVPEALRLIAAERVTTLSGVPTMAREIIAHPDFATTDVSSLRSLSGGGAPMPPDLVLKIEASPAPARPRTGFGMTETCGIIASNSGDFFVDKPDSVGPAMPTFEAACVDDDGRPVPAGALGELVVKGACVIKGYINAPEATAAAIRDGWLHTGDIARIDADGFIFIVDRKKEMVLRGGENVYCAEVEAAIYRHAAVAECSVFGVADERLGEEVAVAILLRDGAVLSEADMQAHCAAIIARHKVPRYMWFVDAPLPRNANGKFLKRELRARFEQGLAAAA